MLFEMVGGEKEKLVVPDAGQGVASTVGPDGYQVVAEALLGDT